jgi:hypothetical protein
VIVYDDMAPFIDRDALDECYKFRTWGREDLTCFVSIVLLQYETVTTLFLNLLLRRHGAFSA